MRAGPPLALRKKISGLTDTNPWNSGYRGSTQHGGNMKLIARLISAALAVTALTATPAFAADGDPLAAWNNALANTDTAQANIVWLGSSTTYGNNATAPDKRYVNLVTNRLRGSQGPEPVVRPASNYPNRNTEPGVHGYLSAFGGTTSENYVNDSTRPWILWERPSLIVHMIGSNDSIDAEPYAVTAAEYEANVAAEVDRLDAGAQTPISHVLVHTYRRAGTSLEKWATYRDALERVAASRSNVLVVDISAEYEQADHIGADPLNLIDTDGVHQTDAGHAFMADLLAPTLGAAAPVPVEPAPVSTPPAPAATPSAAPVAPIEAKAPAAPSWVRAVRNGQRAKVVWRKVADADTYVVRCGNRAKKTTGSRAIVRSGAKRCAVRSMNDAGTSPWVRVVVKRKT